MNFREFVGILMLFVIITSAQFLLDQTSEWRIGIGLCWVKIMVKQKFKYDID